MMPCTRATGAFHLPGHLLVTHCRGATNQQTAAGAALQVPGGAGGSHGRHPLAAVLQRHGPGARLAAAAAAGGRVRPPTRAGLLGAALRGAGAPPAAAALCGRAGHEPGRVCAPAGRSPAGEAIRLAPLHRKNCMHARSLPSISCQLCGCIPRSRAWWWGEATALATSRPATRRCCGSLGRPPACA